MHTNKLNTNTCEYIHILNEKVYKKDQTVKLIGM